MPFSNPTFRPAPQALPGRSPSPPRRYIEPLSPKHVTIKPAPIEPNFNYPAINDNVHFTVRPEQAHNSYNATPKSTTQSSSYRAGHHRTPSTIDTLAEAALAVSPSYHAPVAGAQYGLGASYRPSMPSGYGMSEPPHKRTRSEILPSPYVSQYASRPATSYECGQHSYGTSMQPPHGAHSYDSRIEEASLLLNFRTGGLPASSSLRPPPPQAPAASMASGSRPHANSFPQSAHASRPADLAHQTGLLPPFAPQYHAQSQLGSPVAQNVAPSSNLDANTFTDPHTSSTLDPTSNVRSAKRTNDLDTEDAVVQVLQRQHDGLNGRAASSAPSVDFTMGGTPEANTKIRRGMTKGKSRASTRKSVGEKTSVKKAASRKKTPDSSKVSRNASDVPLAPELNHKRRNSFGGAATLSRMPTETNVKLRRASSLPLDNAMLIRPASRQKPIRKSNKAIDNIVCAGCETTRETSSLNGELDQWISCNGCKRWFHVDCAGFRKAAEVRDVDKYFCTACEATQGKTTYKRKSTRAHVSVDYAELQRGVLKTSEESVEHHYIQPIKDGTFQFDPETFPRMRPELVTKEFFERSGTFVEPICIPAAWNPRPWLEKQSQASHDDNPTTDGNDLPFTNLMPEDYEYDAVPDEGQDKLDMIMPENLTVRQVCNLVGPEVPLDVIDVKTQNSGAKWTLGRWADYYEENTDDKPIRNVISLEVSRSKLGRLLRRPKVVRDIDLQDQVWPQKETDLGKYPKVQYYCLMSVADSFTDFHIDFGGSSVYYHILKGKKTFFFIPPKAKHLKAYEEWNDSPQQNYTFLPNITKECYRVDLSEGDTMLIPSGWIHAVWTPETSLVIGGNFINRMSYKNQFRIVEIEKNNNTPMKFRYPYFQKIMWYTTIQYLEQDPLPKAVSELFLAGHKFERQTPIWEDFDGDMAANDPRPGAKNARYYSQAEIEGLPDLCNYIFRTVMLVMGRVEGISQDRMKRVNASIPKGHGEPLEIAKTFALWVAWKCGNENPPAWAHPDAVLPASKEEGGPKKLSARALKEMERKEAIAAWRIAPDRQSARVKNAVAAGTTGTSGPASTAAATPERTSSSSYPAPAQTSAQHPSQDIFNHQMALPQAMHIAPPMHPMIYGMAGQHISTPKTSVLGPKRVACDACRKRRIRCKHKDLVVQTPSVPQMSPAELHENITVTPPRPQPVANHIADSADAQQNGVQNGNTAYINASIPMSINGATVFGDSAKRGRSKACFECRKSKRRCIHDENGNVDPIKAAETPVPRGSNSSKKRVAEDGSPMQAKKKLKQSTPEQAPTRQPSTAPTEPSAMQSVQSRQPSPPRPVVAAPEKDIQPTPETRKDEHQPAAIDPNLYSPYPEPTDHGYYQQSYSYPGSNFVRLQQYGPADERGHSHSHSQSYRMPSLEQIASDVLNMDDEDDSNMFEDSMSSGVDVTRPDESVDSAVSLPGSDDGKQPQNDEPATGTISHQPQSDIPLYRPPPPPSQSPEQTKRQPHAMLEVA